jgi:hypothetical protein
MAGILRTINLLDGEWRSRRIVRFALYGNRARNKT